MTLETLGWNSSFEESMAQFRDQGLEPARVAVEDRHSYLVCTAKGEMPAQAAGKLLYSAQSAAALPKVGDWVAVSIFPSEGKGVIHHVLPRRTKLSRKVPGREVEEHILATNIDIVFLVEAVDQTFNARLLERYLVMVFQSGAKPVVVLNKADLCDNISERLAQAQTAAGETPVIAVSAKTGQALERLSPFIREGETIVFIGPSGVGKSTLINRIFGEEIQATTEVRESDSKGRHTTTRRELILLPQGGMLIDTPGVREFHLWMAGEGLLNAFADMDDLAVHCHFRDCTHTVEKKCAVLDATTSGQIPQERYQNYLKLRKELAHLAATQNKKSSLEKKRRDKAAHRAFNKFKRLE
jgi:ribosome biogenesis GTPase